MNKINKNKILLILSWVNNIFGILSIVAFQLGYLSLTYFLYTMIFFCFFGGVYLVLHANPIILIINVIFVIACVLYQIL